MWQPAEFCFFFFSLFHFEIPFWQIKYFKRYFIFLCNFFLEIFENFSMSKYIIILVKPAHQLWYPTLSWKYYLVKEENYSHCCNWKDGVDVCATSNPGMRNWNTGIASPIGKVHTWLDLLNSDCCMHTPQTSCSQLSQSQDQFVTQFKWWLFFQLRTLNVKFGFTCVKVSVLEGY